MPPNLHPYKSNSTQAFTMLSAGLIYVISYFRILGMGLRMSHINSQHKFIERNLMPSAKIAKHKFDDMMEFSQEELDKIDLDLERTVSNHITLLGDLRNIEAEEAMISVKLKRKQIAVKDARANHNLNRIQLLYSRDILRSAEVKLQKARKDTAVIVGIALSFIPLFGLLAGLIALIIAATSLQDALTEASYQTEVAREEVDLSSRTLQEVMSSEEKVEKDLHQLCIRKKITELKLKVLKESIVKLKQDQQKIKEFNEKKKNCHRALCSFHGTFVVLWSETIDGYSLSLLQDATQPVVESVRSLLNSSSVNDLCGRGTLEDLNYHFKEIEQVTSTDIRNRPYDVDLHYLI